MQLQGIMVNCQLLLLLLLLLTVTAPCCQGQSIARLGLLPGIPDVPVMRAPPQCQDLLPNCVERKARGECVSNPVDLLPNCPLTCDSCLPTTPSECVDRAGGRNCLYAALLGECSANPSYNLRYCAGSCKQFIDVCRPENRQPDEPCASPRTVAGSREGCGYAGAAEAASRGGRGVNLRRGRAMSGRRATTTSSSSSSSRSNRAQKVQSRQDCVYVGNTNPIVAPVPVRREGRGDGSNSTSSNDTLPAEDRQVPRVTPLPRTTPRPLNQVQDPFVPFCIPSKVDDLRVRLQALVGRNTGRPLPEEAVPLLEAINYCQFGGQLLPEFAEDVFNGSPPPDWRGLSSPTNPAPAAARFKRQDGGSGVLRMNLNNLRRPRSDDNRDVKQQGPRTVPRGTFANGEIPARVPRQGLDSQPTQRYQLPDATARQQYPSLRSNSPGWRPVPRELTPVYSSPVVNFNEDNRLDSANSNPGIDDIGAGDGLQSVFIRNSSAPATVNRLKPTRDFQSLRPVYSNDVTDTNLDDIVSQAQNLLRTTRTDGVADQLSGPSATRPTGLYELPDGSLDSTGSGNLTATNLTSDQQAKDDVSSSDSSDAPGTPGTPDTSDTSDTPDTPDTSDSPDSPDTSDTPDTPDTPDSSTFEDLIFNCGGSLITDRHVLTAAHCIIGTQGSGGRPGVIRLVEEAEVEGGPNSTKDYRITDISSHPEYQPLQSRYFDIAVMNDVAAV